MSCNSCGTTPKSYNYYKPQCNTSLPDQIDASKVMYTGSALVCSGITPNSTLEQVLANINTAICNYITVDWSTFDYDCLPEYTSPQEFAEGISGAYCTLNTNYNTFVNTTFPSVLDSIDDRFDLLELPEVESTCTINSISIADTDSTQVVQQKLSDITCYLSGLLNVSSANWSSCYTVSPAPITPVAGFNVLISQICSLKSSVDSWNGVLPTFNNTGTCLPTPSASESLYDTVVKIRNKACASISYDVDNVVWGNCVADPTSITGTTLEDTITHLVSKIEPALINRLTAVTSDFTLTQTTPGDTCSGFTLALNTSIANSKVALDNTDNTPDFLLDKITAGTGISFDTGTTPGTVIINNSISNTDRNVAVSSNDTTPKSLSEKLVGSSGTVTVTATITGSGDEVLEISADIDPDAVADEILDSILGDSALQTKFCTAVSNCNTTPSGNSSTFYVSNKQTGIGDGSAINPYATIDEAYNAVIGSGDVNNPQYTNSNIYVYKGTYSTSINSYIRGISYHFEPGTYLNYTGDYFMDSTPSTNFDQDVYITGGLIFNSFTGGLLYLKGDSLSTDSWFNTYIELDSASYNTGLLSGPNTKPFIYIECTNSNSAYGRPTLELRLNRAIASNGQTIIHAVGGPRLVISGQTPDSGLVIAPPSSNTANCLFWDFGGSNTSYAYSSYFRISDISMGGARVNEFIQLKGLTGYSTIQRCRSAGSFAGALAEKLLVFNDLRPVTPSGTDSMILIDNFQVPAEALFNDSDIISGTRTNSNYNRVNFKDCVIPPGYYINKTNLNYNVDIVCAHNIEDGKFNISNIPDYADESAATIAGLKSGDIFRETSTNYLSIVT